MHHEIFLTAVVKDADIPVAMAVLGGMTEMREQRQFTRVRYLQRDAAVKGLPTIKEIQKEKVPTTAQYTELHQILLKQSYLLQERVNITDDLRPAESAEVPAEKPRLLRWSDLPDPATTRTSAFTTQRRMLEISDRRVEKVLADNKFTTKDETIELSYQWWLNGVEYALVSIFRVPVDPEAPNKIPALPDLKPFAPIWMLYVRVQIESNHERMQQAYVQLQQAQKDLVGLFEFKVFDRRVHDTRIM
ncbi:mediator complex, subunit Med18 [Podospora didyma]|uniref:Mediator of RNA polymerase II transcription subunit 18 n=1 Tax=Podospora didyma TaxID=330526 RepID=A0AAE0NSU0_9PEZI|nr:mediator complex, subunit Med18 [Podospora didyma]